MESDNPECVKHSAMLDAGIRNQTRWAVMMWESTPHVASSWTYGVTYHMGDFDACFESGPPFQQQYCLARIDVSLEALAARQIEPSFAPVHWGVCVPASCSPEDVVRSLQSALPPGMTASIEQGYCSSTTEPDSSFAGSMSLLVAFLILVLVTIVASIIDEPDQKEQGNPGRGKSLLLCFSAPRNWAELCRVDEKQSSRLPLHALDGFRSLSSFFILFGHYAQFLLKTANANPLHYRRVAVENQQYPFITEGTLYVYSLFVLGGLLTGVLNFYDRRKPLAAILDRFIRLAPMVLVTMLTTLALLLNVHVGPMQGYIRERREICHDVWWSDLFFISNLGFVNESCLPHFWYLSADMHLFILAVLVILPLLRYRQKVGIAASVVISLICMAVSFYQCYVNDWPHHLEVTMEFSRDPDAIKITMQRLGRTHLNVPAYLFGLCLGSWLIQNHKSEKPFQLSESGARRFKWAGASLCLATMYMGSTLHIGKGTLMQRALYFAIHRVPFCAGTALFFAGLLLRPRAPQGVLQKIQAKLQFSVYAFHVPVMLCFHLYQRTTVYLSVFGMTAVVVGMYCLLLGLSLMIHLFVEIPCTNIRSVLMKKPKKD